jgi:hypothetical protein
MLRHAAGRHNATVPPDNAERPKASPGLTDPAALVRLVASIGELDIESGDEPDSADTDLHHGTVLSIAESLDSWLVLGFRARPRGRLPGDLPSRRCPGPETAAVIEPSVYDSLVEVSRAYRAKLEAAAGPEYGPSPASGS